MVLARRRSRVQARSSNSRRAARSPCFIRSSNPCRRTESSFIVEPAPPGGHFFAGSCLKHPARLPRTLKETSCGPSRPEYSTRVPREDQAEPSSLADTDERFSRSENKLIQKDQAPGILRGPGPFKRAFHQSRR